jgi:putative DNA primase/helicase
MTIEFVQPTLPPADAERLRQILNGVAVAPPSEKRPAFIISARRVFGEIVGPHYTLTAAVDRLWDTADVQGLTDDLGPDIIQSDLAAASEEPLVLDEDGPLSSADSLPRDLNAEVRRLAALGAFEYERERKGAAERLSVRTAVLDKLIAAEREKSDDGGKQGRALSLPEHEPWPEPVNGAELLDALSAVIRRYVVMSEHAANSAALWAVHTHLIDCLGITPRLAVISPEKGCGKTTALDVVSHLVARPLATANATASAIFRVVEMKRPTLLIDEADTFLPENEELRGILNSGHRRGGSVIRTVGDEFEPRSFSTYSACAVALIGKLPATLADRSVVIELRRRRPDEVIEGFRFDRTEHLGELGRKSARWAQDIADGIRDADPVMPEGVVNRAADNWRPLLAIADVAGSTWPRRAREAANSAGSSAAASGEQSRGVLLLSDIRAIFTERQADRLSSKGLADALASIEGRPWAEMGKTGKAITQNSIARLLAPFKISPDSVRMGDATPKGYLLAQFEDAFSRYLPPEAF